MSKIVFEVIYRIPTEDKPQTATIVSCSIESALKRMETFLHGRYCLGVIRKDHYPHFRNSDIVGKIL